MAGRCSAAGRAGGGGEGTAGQDGGSDGAYLLGVGELRAAERRAAPPGYAEDGGAGGGVRMARRGGCWKPFLGFRQAFLLEHFLGGERRNVSSRHRGPRTTHAPRPAPGTATCEVRPSRPGPWSLLGRRHSATLGCDTVGPGGSRCVRHSPRGGAAHAWLRSRLRPGRLTSDAAAGPQPRFFLPSGTRQGGQPGPLSLSAPSRRGCGDSSTKRCGRAGRCKHGECWAPR